MKRIEREVQSTIYNVQFEKLKGSLHGIGIPLAGETGSSWGDEEDFV